MSLHSLILFSNFINRLVKLQADFISNLHETSASSLLHVIGFPAAN
jgi:hypothetical protein